VTHNPRFAFLAALALAAMASNAAGTDEFLYCTTCHGAEGNGNLAIRAPKIAGMERWYVDAQLAAFRAGWRGTDPADNPGHEMRPVAAVLPNDETVARASAFAATFTPIAPPVTVQGDAAHGAALYAACAACHGAEGRGNEALAAPALAGQSDWYLVAQLHNYHDGRRGMHKDDIHGATMQPFAAALADDAAIVDVVAYINSLH
jgi:cytochrome c oxidase subunit 2